MSASSARMHCTALWMACKTRAALAHHRVGRHLDREAGLERRDPRQVGGVGALLGLADDDLVDRLRLNAGTLDGRGDDDARRALPVGPLLIDPPTLPKAVRTAETMTTSFMDDHPSQTNDIVPPSTYRTVPVMKSEAADARKTDGPTRSSMSAMRPIGTLSSIRS